MQKKGCLSVFYCACSFLLSLVGLSEARNGGVVPSQYILITEQETAVNGSLAAGNCSDISNAEGATVCRQPASSVLFDGKTPTLTGLSGNMWASQLFTLSSAAAVDGGRSPSIITFDFQDTPDYMGVGAVEVAIFNCPDWGLAVQSIKLQGGTVSFSNVQNPSISCTSLVRVMLCSQSQLTSSDQESCMVFDLQPNSDRVYIAEVTFFPTAVICETPDTPLPLRDTTASMQAATTLASSPQQGTTRAGITPQDTTETGTTPQAGITETGPTPQGTTETGTAPQSTSETGTTPHGTNIAIPRPASTIKPAATTLPPTTEFDSLSQTMHSNADVNMITPTEASTELNDVPTSTIILAAVLTGVLITACLLAAVLILCYVKHYKHTNTNHHPAVGEGHGNIYSHPPPVTLCEETAQAYYSTKTAAEREDSSLEYSYVQRDTLLERETPKPSNSPSGEYYVIKTKAYREPAAIQDGVGNAVCTVVDGKKQNPPEKEKSEKEKSKEVLTSIACSITDIEEPEGKYAIVKQTQQNAISSESEGHVYAVLEREGVKIQPEVNTSTTHVYSVLENRDVKLPQQVNASNDHVYAVLENEAVLQQPEVDVSTGHVYAVLEKENTKTSEGAVANTLKNQLHTAVVVGATHSYAPETGTPVNQVYAQVDKKKKKGKGKEVCEDFPQEN